MIYVIDDDPIMADCVVRACAKVGKSAKIFSDALAAMNAISSQPLPELIFLDILLIGPDGFTFLNELVSYTDTARIPVVVITSLHLKEQDLSDYGVVGVLFKDQMYPEDIKAYVEKYAN